MRVSLRVHRARTGTSCVRLPRRGLGEVRVNSRGSPVFLFLCWRRATVRLAARCHQGSRRRHFGRTRRRPARLSHIPGHPSPSPDGWPRVLVNRAPAYANSVPKEITRAGGEETDVRSESWQLDEIEIAVHELDEGRRLPHKRLNDRSQRHTSAGHARKQNVRRLEETELSTALLTEQGRCSSSFATG